MPATQRNTITAQRVRDLLHYDPETGIFTWKYQPDQTPQWNGKWAGRQAGGKAQRKGITYIRINVDGVLIYAHRLAFLWMTGRFPKGRIDHRDHDGTNNRWKNLRPATQRQNMGNMKGRSRTGFKGVQPTRAGRFTAMIRNHGRYEYLGTFDTAPEAGDAYAAAAKRIYGEFAETENLPIEDGRLAERPADAQESLFDKE